MKRRITHLWRYITSPSYKLFVDLMTSQEVVNQRVNEMKRNIELSTLHPVIAEQVDKYSMAYGISVMDAKEVIKAQNGTS